MNQILAYQKQQTEITEQIVLLKKKLKKHSVSFNKTQSNWSFVGDLNHVLENVKELNQFLNV
jgi:hypothetical protein